jgi:ribosomal 50S subunit-associated protein YjgA (DUF615 family)
LARKKGLSPSEEAPSFIDYNNRIVPITPLRMELSQLQKDGLDTIPLGELLRTIARVIKENKGGTV